MFPTPLQKMKMAILPWLFACLMLWFPEAGYAWDFSGQDRDTAWESLRPAEWVFEGGSVRWRTTVDKANPEGAVLYRRDRYLRGDGVTSGRFVFGEGDGGDGFLGIALGAKSWYESGSLMRTVVRVGMSEDGRLRLLLPAALEKLRPVDVGLAALEQREVEVRRFQAGEEFWIETRVTLDRGSLSLVSARVRWDGGQSADLVAYLPTEATEGFCGVAAQGDISFQVREFLLEGLDVETIAATEPTCVAAYALANSLREGPDGRWTARFIGVFRGGGERMEIRVADAAAPGGGWNGVAVAGSGAIEMLPGGIAVATAEVVLPGHPAAADAYYTVWRDGKDVTADPREAAVSGSAAVGRLPRLAAPYRVAWFGPEELRDLPEMPWPPRAPVEGRGGFRDFGYQLVVRELDPWRHPEPLRPSGAEDAWARWRQTWGGTWSRRQLLEHWTVIRVSDPSDEAAEMGRVLAGPPGTWRFPGGDVAWMPTGRAEEPPDWGDLLAREPAPVVVVLGGVSEKEAKALGARSGVMVLGGTGSAAGIMKHEEDGVVAASAEAFGGGTGRFVEWTADPGLVDGALALAVRELGQGPETPPRPEATWSGTVSGTGRAPGCRFPETRTLAEAEVRILRTDGRLVRAIRSTADGSVPLQGLAGVEAGTRLLVLAFDGEQARADVVTTMPRVGEVVPDR